MQGRRLLLDPSWLEVKLHCYGVAAVVDDFRTYLQQVQLGSGAVGSSNEAIVAAGRAVLDALHSCLTAGWPQSVCVQKNKLQLHTGGVEPPGGSWCSSVSHLGVL